MKLSKIHFNNYRRVIKEEKNTQENINDRDFYWELVNALNYINQFELYNQIDGRKVEYLEEEVKELIRDTIDYLVFYDTKKINSNFSFK